ncbi:MAG: hypothetical protein SFV51_28070 [Bryobacteraceae bacterium]|nr:hypothetical protein [Bryobacteraceae bacterium]
MASKYPLEPMDFSAMKTIPIAERGGKVGIPHMARPYQKGTGVGGLLASLPDVLAAPSLLRVIDSVVQARERKRAILWGLGGHVIKCGLAPVLLDLMRRGFVTGFVLNGAASIHDFEIGIAGHTSEDVEAVLPDGRFGSAEETGREMNEAIAAGVARGLGMGESLGARLAEIAVPDFAPCCLVLEAWRAAVPVTVHVAVGTDTPHTHPAADASAIGQGTHRDFRLLCSMLREMDDGGVYLNVGSAVVLPEVFLKAVSVVRNLGHPLARFTTVNLDFLQHYRPKMNVVDRPHAQSGGKGYGITGHHELMIPLLAAALIERTP